MHKNHKKKTNLLFTISPKLNGNILILLPRPRDQLRTSQSRQLRSGHPRRQSLSRQSNNGRARPQHVHARRVSITQRRVQTNIRQLPPPHVLLFGRHITEQNFARRQTQLLRRRLKVLLSDGGESQKPQNRVRHAL